MKFSVLIILVFLFLKISAQNIPQSVNYQAVATDNKGQALANQDIIVEISILRDSENGSLEYQELHNLTTDRFGLFNLSIGKGNALNSGAVSDFSLIDWESGNFYLKTAVDFGVSEVLNGLIETGTVKFESVPYSFRSAHSFTADSLTHLPFIKLSDIQDINLSSVADNQVLTWQASSGTWIAADPGASGVAFLQADGSVDLISDWTISSHSLYLTGGNIELTNGLLKSNKLALQIGDTITEISSDSTFSNVSNEMLSTAQAVKYYVDSLTKATYWTGSSTTVVMQNTSSNLGIGTLNPDYKFHFSGGYEDAFQADGTYGGNAPSPGTGTRMAFYPAKAAFRAGRVNENPAAWDDANIGAYSAAFGYDTETSGNYSFSGGKSNLVTGGYSVAFGADNQIYNSYSAAFGTANELNGLYSFSAGRENSTTGAVSAAFGCQTQAKGENSVTFGNQTRTGQSSGTGGINALAGGNQCVAEGDNSAALGNLNTSKAAASFVSGNSNYIASSAEASALFGYQNNMYAKYALGFGEGTKISSFSQLVFGRYNTQIGTDYAGWTDTDALMILGNGISDSERSNAFVVLKNGNTGIGLGANSPTVLLEVGQSGDGTFALANAWNTYSDRRLKTDIIVFTNVSEKMKNINTYTYNWKNGKDKRRQIGFIAQEVENVFPNLVYENSQGIKSLDYGKFTPVLWQAFKEQQQTISELDKEIKEQEKRIEKLENLIIGKQKRATF